MRIEPAVVADADRLADAWVRLAREQHEYGTHLLPEANRQAIREDLARRIVVGEVLVARRGDGDVPDEGGPGGNDTRETGDRGGNEGEAARDQGGTEGGATRDPGRNQGKSVGDPGDDEDERTGDFLGFVSFGRNHDGLETDVERGIVHNLYVHPDHRHRGIGSALLGAAEECLAEDGAEAVALESMARNESARRFYRERGYRPHRIEFEKRLGRGEQGRDSGSE